MEDRFKYRFWNGKFMCNFDIFRTVYEMELVSNFIIDKKITPIMQCTGLKDKNGNLIYEGDIVKIFHVSGSMQGNIFYDVVKWNAKQCRFDTEKYGRFEDDDVYEVIGNIYENPELLEGRE